MVFTGRILVGELLVKMRIISGQFRGKIIKYLKNSTTRPLRDSVKENIFNILQHSKLIKIKIENGYILDLYSGVGSFGIECISRGAKNVTFIENNLAANQIIKKNLNYLSIINKAKIYNENVEVFLRRKINEKYNVFFLDPPYIDKKFIQNFDLIKANKLYQKNHIIIIHRDSTTEDGLENYIKILIKKKYGRSKITFGVFIE